MHDFVDIPFTIGSAIMSSAGAVVAQGWPDGAVFFEIDSDVRIAINAWSTAAAFPSTNSEGSTAGSIIQNTGHQHIYRIPGDSTGYSVTSASSGVMTISFYGIT